MSATDLETRPSDPELDDEDRMAHICRKDDITRAYIEGTSIKALCGYVWVPSRNPDNYPVCQRCLDIAEGITNAGNN